MSKRQRRNPLPAFKAKVALAALRGEKTLAELVIMTWQALKSDRGRGLRRLRSRAWGPSSRSYVREIQLLIEIMIDRLVIYQIPSCRYNSIWIINIDKFERYWVLDETKFVVKIPSNNGKVPRKTP